MSLSNHQIILLKTNLMLQEYFQKHHIPDNVTSVPQLSNTNVSTFYSNTMHIAFYTIVCSIVQLLNTLYSITVQRYERWRKRQCALCLI